MARPNDGDHDKEISISASKRHTNNVTHLHKVEVPPKQNLFVEFKSTVKETFFADDPLRNFKDQTGSKRFMLGLQAVFPILEWGRDYNLTKFKGDIISGLTIASLCIPQDIAYAKLANPVTDVDTSGIHSLEELYKSLQKRKIKLILANPGPVVMEKLHSSDLAQTIGEENIFLTVAHAVQACQPQVLVENA